MKFVVFTLGSLQTNCYLLENDGRCVVIDAADSADFILEYTQREKLQIEVVIATHGHFDHVLAAGEICASTGADFWVNPEDDFLLKRTEKTARHFLQRDPLMMPFPVPTALKEGTFELAGIKIDVIHTPGHTPGSCCLYVKDEAAIFTGDVVFKDGIGDYQHKYSSKADLLASLHKLAKLPPMTRVNPGHGEEMTVKEVGEMIAFL